MSLDNPLSSKPLPVLPTTNSTAAASKGGKLGSSQVLVNAPTIAIKTTVRQVGRERIKPLPIPPADSMAKHKVEELKEKKPVNQAALQSGKEKCTRACAKLLVLFKGAGKGAKPMAESYWPELLHSEHGYGRELRSHFEEWKGLNTTQSFDDWVKAEKVIKQNVSYLNPEERKEFAATLNSGRIATPHEGPLNTASGSAHIFVLSPDNKLYAGLYDRGKFNHSSFLSGSAVQSAGELFVKDGKITKITDKSGHYESNVPMVLTGVIALLDAGADLKGAKVILNAHPESKLDKVQNDAIRFIAQNMTLSHVREVSTPDSLEFAVKELKNNQFMLRLSSDKESIVVVKNTNGKVTQVKAKLPENFEAFVKKQGGVDNLVPYYKPQAVHAEAKEEGKQLPNLPVANSDDTAKFAKMHLSDGQFSLRLSSDQQDIVVIKKANNKITQTKVSIDSDIAALIKKYGTEKYVPFTK